PACADAHRITERHDRCRFFAVGVPESLTGIVAALKRERPCFKKSRRMLKAMFTGDSAKSRQSLADRQHRRFARNVADSAVAHTCEHLDNHAYASGIVRRNLMKEGRLEMPVHQDQRKAALPQL